MLRDDVQLVITGINATTPAFIKVTADMRAMGDQIRGLNVLMGQQKSVTDAVIKGYAKLGTEGAANVVLVKKEVELLTAAIQFQIKEMDRLALAYAGMKVPGGIPSGGGGPVPVAPRGASGAPRVLPIQPTPPSQAALSMLTPGQLAQNAALDQAALDAAALTNAGIAPARAKQLVSGATRATAQEERAIAQAGLRRTTGRNLIGAAVAEKAGIPGRAFIGASLLPLGIPLAVAGFGVVKASQAGAGLQSAAFQTLAQAGYGADTKKLAAGYDTLTQGIIAYSQTGKNPFDPTAEARDIQPLISHYGLTNALAMLPAVAQLSAQNKAPDIKDAVNLINTFAANVGAGSKTTPAQVQDIANYVSKLETITTVAPGKLTGAFPTILTAISGTGISPEDAGGLFLKVAQAAPANVQRDATNFSRFIIGLTRKNTAGSNKAATELFGMPFGPGFIDKYGGIMPAIQEIATATAGPNQGKLLGTLFPQVNGLRALQEVMGGQGLGLAQQYSTGLSNRAGAGATAFNTLSMGVNQKNTQLLSRFNADLADVGLTINKTLIPAMQNLASQGLGALEKAFSAASDLFNNPDLAKSFLKHFVSVGDAGFGNSTKALSEAQSDTIAARKAAIAAAALAKNPNSTFLQTHPGRVVQTNEGLVLLPTGGGQTVHLGAPFSTQNFGTLPANQVHVANTGTGPDAYFQLVANHPGAMIPGAGIPSKLGTQPGAPGNYYSGFYANYARRHRLTTAQQQAGGPLPPTTLTEPGVSNVSADVARVKGRFVGRDITDASQVYRSPFASIPNTATRIGNEDILGAQLRVLASQTANNANALNQATRDARSNLNADIAAGKDRATLNQDLVNLAGALTTSAYTGPKQGEILGFESRKVGKLNLADDKVSLATGLAQYKLGNLSTADLRTLLKNELQDIPFAGLSKAQQHALGTNVTTQVNQAIYLDTQLKAANLQVTAAQIQQDSARIHHASTATQVKDANATYKASLHLIDTQVAHGDLKGLQITDATNKALDTLDSTLQVLAQNGMIPFQDKITNAQLRNDPAAFKQAIKEEIAYDMRPENLMLLYGGSKVARDNAVLQLQQQAGTFMRLPGPQLIRPNTTGLGFPLAGPGSTIAQLSGGTSGPAQTIALLQAQLRKEEQANGELRQMVAYLRQLVQGVKETAVNTRPKAPPPATRPHKGGTAAA